MHNQSFFLVQNQAFSPVCLGNVLVFDPGALRQLWSHESSTQWWLSPIPHGWIFSRFNLFSNNYRNLDHRHIPHVSEILHTLAINCSVNSSWQNGNTLINMSRCKGIRWVPETALGQSCLGGVIEPSLHFPAGLLPHLHRPHPRFTGLPDVSVQEDDT